MNLNLQVNNEIFGGGDAVVKYVLEGHDRWGERGPASSWERFCVQVH